MDKTPGWIVEVIRDVAELPYRDSPPDQPGMMLVTSEELQDILERNRPQIEAEARAAAVADVAKFIETHAVDLNNNSRLIDVSNFPADSTRSAYAREIRALATTPAGHAVVPVEPTPAMIYEGIEALESCKDSDYSSAPDGSTHSYETINTDAPAIIYRAMLEARPK